MQSPANDGCALRMDVKLVDSAAQNSVVLCNLWIVPGDFRSFRDARPNSIEMDNELLLGPPGYRRLLTFVLLIQDIPQRHCVSVRSTFCRRDKRVSYHLAATPLSGPIL
jgi:hypothetical protein